MYQINENRDGNDFAALGNNILYLVGGIIVLLAVYWTIGQTAAQVALVFMLVLATLKILSSITERNNLIQARRDTDMRNVDADIIAASTKPAEQTMKLAVELVKGANANTKADNDMQGLLIKGLLANGFLDKAGPEFTQRFGVLDAEPNPRLAQSDDYDDDDIIFEEMG